MRQSSQGLCERERRKVEGGLDLAHAGRLDDRRVDADGTGEIDRQIAREARDRRGIDHAQRPIAPLERSIPGKILAQLDLQRNVLDHRVAGQIEAVVVDREAQAAVLQRHGRRGNRRIGQGRAGGDPHLLVGDLTVQRQADREIDSRRAGSIRRREPRLGRKTQRRMVDQGQDVAHRAGRPGLDLELGRLASRKPHAGDHDTAAIEQDVADPACADREIHAARREARAAVDFGERRQLLVIADGQILEAEAALDDALRHRPLCQIAGLDADRSLRLRHDAVRDVLDHPCARCVARLGRPEPAELARRDVARLDLGRDRDLATRPRQLARSGQARSQRAGHEALQPEVREIARQLALRLQRVDRQRRHEQVRQIHLARTAGQLEAQRRPLAVRPDAAEQAPPERQPDPAERQPGRQAREGARHQPVEVQAEADPIGRRLVAAG